MACIVAMYDLLAIHGINGLETIIQSYKQGHNSPTGPSLQLLPALAPTTKPRRFICHTKSRVAHIYIITGVEKVKSCGNSPSAIPMA